MLKIMNNQTEPGTETIEIPGINHSCVEVFKDDLIKLSKCFGEMKKKEPRNYIECIESLEFSILRNKSISKTRFSTLEEYEMDILVLDGMVKRIVDHLEYGEQLMKKAN